VIELRMYFKLLELLAFWCRPKDLPLCESSHGWRASPNLGAK